MLFFNELELAGLLLSIILLFNLKSVRILPMKSGKTFEILIYISIFVILSDFSLALLDHYARGRYNSTVVFLDTMFYIAVGFYFFFARIFCSSLAYEKMGKYFRPGIITYIPMLVYLSLVVLNLFTGIIFKVTQYGYQRSGYYDYIVFPYFAFEIILGTYKVYWSRKMMPRRLSYSIYASSFLTLFALFYQIYIDSRTFLISGGIAFALMVVYVAYIESDNDNEIKTGSYNAHGFKRYMTEQIQRGCHYREYFIQVEGYNALLSMLSREKIDNILGLIGRQLEKRNMNSFYLHSGLFAVVETDERKFDECIKNINTVIDGLGNYNREQIDISFRILTVSDDCGIEYSGEMLTVVNDVMDARDYDRKMFENISTDDVKASKKRQKLRRAIYRSLKTGGVKVYYQPIYDNHSEQIRSAEALARIYDKEMGIIYPDSFIPLFEQDGKILKLGKIVFENVCRFIRDNDMEALGLDYIEVNLSPVQCMQPSLPEELIEIADRYRVDLSYINFEITETANLTTERLLKLMTMLIEKGASFSVDDFGTGYSNIIRVSNLPFRIIKMDKSILWDYFKNKDEMVPRIYEIMRKRGFAMVTEGVETDEMHNWLKTEAKCQYEQGYLYSKPIDEKDFVEYLKQYRKKPA